MASQMTVLIVDDEPGMSETLNDILTDFGYHVEVARNGYEAIDRVKERAFDIVLMDIRMPGINGVETFKEIKGLRPEAAVMMMTAYSVEELIAEALEEGAYGVMYKPLQVGRVLEFIESVEKGGLILVVDDDPSACESLMDVLREKGYRIATASGGEDALKVVEANNFDVIFIDVRMPVMNGLEVYKAMKKVKPSVKAVMMTGYYSEVDDLVEEAIRSSAYTCLHKPIDIEKLLKVIEAVKMGKSKNEVQSITTGS